MHERHSRNRTEERGLMLVGSVGLATAAFIACSGGDATAPLQPVRAGGAGMIASAGGTPAMTAATMPTASMPPAADGGTPPAAAAPASAQDAGAAPPALDAGVRPTQDAGAADAAVSTSDAGASAADPSACTPSSDTAENTAAVVKAASALLDALTPEQRTAIQFSKTLANARQWSNLPTTFVKRNGVRIGDMSSAAQTAAVALAEAAASSNGASLLSELREADQFLVSDGGASSTDYGRGLYYFAIHGTPSASAAWMLQIAGHHLAYNFTYNGKCTSATPLFDGVEPTTWMDSAGKAHAPLEAQRAAMVALLKAVGTMPDAKLNGTFSDLINGPVGGGPPGLGGSAAGGGGDTRYPSQLSYPSGITGRGAAVSGFSAEQKTLVKSAIAAWVGNAADPIAHALLADYERDAALAQTYVGYSGATDLSTQSSYVRIDGPRVWIEVTIQGGIVYRNRVHYHTIWRDKAADYGAEYAQ